MQFIKPGTSIDFVGMRKVAAIISTILVIASVLLFVFMKPNWGIDFTGGNELQIEFSESVQIGEVRSALGELGVDGQAVQQLGAIDENAFTIRIQDPRFGTEGTQDEVLGALSSSFGDEWIEEHDFVAEVSNKLTVRYTGPVVPLSDIRSSLSDIDGAKIRNAPDDNTFYVDLPALSSKIMERISEAVGGKEFKLLSADSVGPKVGDELTRQGFIAIISTLALILVYVSFRFDLSFAPGAVLALFHDVTIVTGVFVLMQREFNLPMIGALLTIIGYSLNDTIVIYDRIRENMTKYRRGQLPKLINASINETMSRTLATSLTTALGMSAFLLLGGPVIQTFSLAILLGVFVGTYSTIFVASPTILVMQDLRPWMERVFSPLSGTDGSSEDGDDASLTETERRRRARQAPSGDAP
jgi:preprotein translocase subunit SecF